MLKTISAAAAMAAATMLLPPAGVATAADSMPGAAAASSSAKRPLAPQKNMRYAEASMSKRAVIADAQGVRVAPLDANKLAEYLIFETDGFDLDQPTQEGTTGRVRLTQDELQKRCTALRGGDVDAATAARVSQLAVASMKYPEAGIKLGDWKKGGELAWSGFGYRTGHNPDDHSKGPAGGNCYNCHQLALDRTGGSIGPSLTGYGKVRGTSEGILKYTYEVIYNPHMYFPCTHMPRMGAKGVLTEEQIADIMAYLLDPESPVNK